MFLVRMTWYVARSKLCTASVFIRVFSVGVFVCLHVGVSSYVCKCMCASVSVCVCVCMPVCLCVCVYCVSPLARSIELGMCIVFCYGVVYCGLGWVTAGWGGLLQEGLESERWSTAAWVTAGLPAICVRWVSATVEYVPYLIRFPAP